jgi:hypothetical protein
VGPAVGVGSKITSLPENVVSPGRDVEVGLLFDDPPSFSLGSFSSGSFSSGSFSSEFCNEAQ